MASGARGGGADHLLGLLPAQAALGLPVAAAVGTDGPLADRLTERGVVCVPLDVMRRRLSAHAVAQLGACLAHGADVLHAHGTRAAFFAGIASVQAVARRSMGRSLGASPCLVYTAHGLAFRQSGLGPRHLAFAAAEAVACRMADAVASVSAADLTSLRRRGWLWRRTAVHIPNAVDAQLFAPGDRAQARARLGLRADRVWVGTTARLVPQKAVADLMQAVLALPDVHLAIVGDGPQRSILERHPLALAGRARFFGGRDDVAAILPAFDVFALSSRWEGAPIALLEAMACQLPCVATATAGAVELLQPPQCGVCVSVGDTAAFAAALRALLADGRRRTQLAAAGRQAVLQRTYAVQAQQTLALYRGLRGAPC
jgi:glycosyltransferase involved in cell wall biosynthesis